MVDFVDVFVQRPPVEDAVHPVVPGVLEDEEDGDLEGHFEERGEGRGGREAEILRHRVEEPDLRELDGEVAEEDEFGALPLLFGGGEFVLWVVGVSQDRPSHAASFTSSSEVHRGTHRLNLVPIQRRYPVDNHPRYAPAEIHNLMHKEAHDASGEHIVAYVRIPRRPEPFEVVQLLDVVLGNLVELGPIGVRWVREHGVGDGAVHRAVAGWTRD